jgi:hypothetical protein
LRRAALALPILLLACKTAAPAPDADASAARSGPDPALYYPLAVGNSWTYQQRGSDRREKIQIVGRDGPWFLDDHRGRLRYESDGVRDADRYLLRAPLSTGAHWNAVDNMVVQRFDVRSLDATAVTEAGTFTHCALIRNEQLMAKKSVFVTEWTYAPKVGLVQVVTSTVAPNGRETEQTRLQLVAYRVQ